MARVQKIGDGRVAPTEGALPVHLHFGRVLHLGAVTSTTPLPPSRRPLPHAPGGEPRAGLGRGEWSIAPNRSVGVRTKGIVLP